MKDDWKQFITMVDIMTNKSQCTVSDAHYFCEYTTRQICTNICPQMKITQVLFCLGRHFQDTVVDFCLQCGGQEYRKALVFEKITRDERAEYIKNHDNVLYLYLKEGPLDSMSPHVRQRLDSLEVYVAAFVWNPPILSSPWELSSEFIDEDYRVEALVEDPSELLLLLPKTSAICSFFSVSSENGDLGTENTIMSSSSHSEGAIRSHVERLLNGCEETKNTAPLVSSTEPRFGCHSIFRSFSCGQLGPGRVTCLLACQSSLPEDCHPKLRFHGLFLGQQNKTKELVSIFLPMIKVSREKFYHYFSEEEDHEFKYFSPLYTAYQENLCCHFQQHLKELAFYKVDLPDCFFVGGSSRYGIPVSPFLEFMEREGKDLDKCVEWAQTQDFGDRPYFEPWFDRVEITAEVVLLPSGNFEQVQSVMEILEHKKHIGREYHNVFSLFLLPDLEKE